MKKKIFILIFLIVVLIGLCLYIFLPLIEEDDYNKSVMTIKEGTLTNTGATVIIKDDDIENTYGEWYRIDRKVFDKWYTLESHIKDWILIGYHASYDHQLELEISWENNYGKLSKGKYRLVKEAGTKERKNNKKEKKYICVEFEIE